MFRFLFTLFFIPTICFGQSFVNDDEAIAGLIPEMKPFADSILQMRAAIQQPMLKLEREKLIKKYNNCVQTYSDSLEHYTFLNKHTAKPASALYYSYKMELITDTAYLERLLNMLPPDGLDNDYGRYMQQEVTGLKNNTVGARVAELTLTDLSGRSVAIADFKGKYILINFWASWCAPCRAENPSLEELYMQYKTKSYEVIAISLDENRAAWKRAVAQDKLTWTNLCDGNAWNSKPARLYSIHRVPQNLLVNPEGIIIAKNLSPRELEKELETLLGK